MKKLLLLIFPLLALSFLISPRVILAQRNPCSAWCCGPNRGANKCDGTYECTVPDSDCAGGHGPGIEIPTYNDISNLVGQFKFALSSPSRIISDLLPYVFALAGLLLLVYLLYGAYQILSSFANPKVIAGGITTITRAIIGFVLLFLSYWFIRLIEILFAVNLI